MGGDHHVKFANRLPRTVKLVPNIDVPVRYLSIPYQNSHDIEEPPDDLVQMNRIFAKLFILPRFHLFVSEYPFSCPP